MYGGMHIYAHNILSNKDTKKIPHMQAYAEKSAIKVHFVTKKALLAGVS